MKGFGRFLLGLAMVLGLPGTQAAVNLGSYNVDANDLVNSGVSVSGISSGAIMSSQLHVAYSGTFKKGAGMVSASPYFCARGNFSLWYNLCTTVGGVSSDPRDVASLVSTTRSWEGSGYIDPTSNLYNSKVYIFSGTLDSVIVQPVTNDVKKFYSSFVASANIYYKNNLPAQHSFPTDNYGNSCATLGLPYINNCGHDTAGEILKWIYGSLNPRQTGALTGQLIQFNQDKFISSPLSHSMASTGWAYVPASCAAGERCRLHVALHGCGQNTSYIGDQFYRHAGYNEWADTNRIIVVYPQTEVNSALGNGAACWDWRGYDPYYPDFYDYYRYARKAGFQMVAIKSMVDKIAAGSKTNPWSCTQTTASNYAHIAAGRAFSIGNGYAYAKGTNQPLGAYSSFVTTTLRQTSAGNYSQGSCP